MSDWLSGALDRRVATAAFPGYVRLGIGSDDGGKGLMAYVDLEPAVAERLAEALRHAAERAQ